MKTHTLVISLVTASLLQAMPPTVGTTSSDVTFSVAENFNSGTRRFESLTDTMLTNRSGKVSLLAYVTPW